ncbi:Uu.00g069020.m01.CDS01 [Anthostomella pinea]|uniref:Uu.00g069020.m01.CDS01 n=1 Tax=Anthostomella pinea TaxID=933095 RepID=A0AAI8VUE9_9PEZI|nr:Uu.00g069020.m01.CDS01 [Anthostomella pinea]
MANCTDAPAAVASDAGVAGIGVLLSFIVTAVVAIGLSATLIFQEARGHSKPSVLRRKLLNAYSDQQILTGIGIQSVGLAKIDSMVPYHFFLIWMLSLLSMAVHNATLLALVHDFRRDWVLRWLRQFLMFVNLALSCVYGVFILEAVTHKINDSTFPIACVWQDVGDNPSANSGGGGGVNVSLSFVGTIVVIAGNVIVFALATWYLHSRSQRFYKTIQIAGLVLMTAIAIGAIVRVSLLADAFASEPPITLRDNGEEQWSFGQLLSVGMLLLPLVSVIEILRGEIRCAPPVADAGDDKQRLLGDSELQSNPKVRASFQPNPFFGSQANLFKK